MLKHKHCIFGMKCLGKKCWYHKYCKLASSVSTLCQFFALVLSIVSDVSIIKNLKKYRAFNISWCPAETNHQLLQPFVAGSCCTEFVNMLICFTNVQYF